jgi:hypothetical protein
MDSIKGRKNMESRKVIVRALCEFESLLIEEVDQGCKVAFATEVNAEIKTEQSGTAAAGTGTEKSREALAPGSVKVISMNKPFARNSQNFPSIRERNEDGLPFCRCPFTGGGKDCVIFITRLPDDYVGPMHRALSNGIGCEFHEAKKDEFYI